MHDLASLFSIQSLVKVWNSLFLTIRMHFLWQAARESRGGSKDSSCGMFQVYEAFQFQGLWLCKYLDS